ncbi:hypothetical protein, partial [Clostridium sp. KNHs214]
MINKEISSEAIIDFFIDYLNIIKDVASSYQYSLNNSAYEEFLSSLSNLDNELTNYFTDDIVK